MFEDLKGEYDFRIPALIYVKEGKTFLAFAEKRTVKNGKSNDENAKNLVMRKGTRQADGSLQVPREALMFISKKEMIVIFEGIALVINILIYFVIVFIYYWYINISVYI